MPIKQQTLSLRLDKADHDRFFESLSVSDKARINSETLSGASDFLEAIPSPQAGLAMAREEFICELKTRLLMDHFEDDSWCVACDCILDKKRFAVPNM